MAYNKLTETLKGRYSLGLGPFQRPQDLITKILFLGFFFFFKQRWPLDFWGKTGVGVMCSQSESFGFISPVVILMNDLKSRV